MEKQAGLILGKTLFIVILLAILGSIAALFYVVAFPQSTEKFSEFYILGIEAKATNYPRQLVVGQEDRVTVGIVNQEHETVSYVLEVIIDGIMSNEVGPITLEHGEKWERIVNFTLNKVGNNQKVEFLLYRQGRNEVYQTLHLWVNVVAAEAL